MNNLTTIEDMNQLIMLEMDIDSLSNYCQINKSVHCNVQFWKKKFDYDHLYYQFLQLPKTLNEWVKTYKILHQSKMDIKHLLLISSIVNDGGTFVIKESKDVIKMLKLYDYFVVNLYSFKITMNIDLDGDYIIKINGDTEIWPSEKAIKFLIAIRYYEYLRHKYLIFDKNNNPYIITDNNRQYNDASEARYYALESILHLENNPYFLKDNWINKLIV